MNRRARIRCIQAAILLLGLAAAGACTTGDTVPAPTAPAPATGAPTVSTPPPPAAMTSGAPPSAAASPTYFSPTDAGSFSMSGPFEVDQALQDPFSNLIQRGGLHERSITLDVVGTPDYPVPAGQPGTLLFGTCKCTLRGQGMHLTVEDGATISDAGGGAIRIRGTFRPVQTEADAFTLARP